MQRKNFTSRLFRKIITVDHQEYWEILYAEVLFRIKVLDDLNCPCSFCFCERIRHINLIKRMISDGHIPENKKPDNFTGIGNCGRKPEPAA